MNTPNSLRTMSAWDRAAIVLLGAAGFAFSYDALRQVALAIHARPTLSYLFPVFVDGFIAYGVRALVLLRHSGFGARLYTWVLFLAATGSSLWANALHAITLNRTPQTGPSGPSPLHLGDNVVGILSTLAPLALAGSVHLYIIMARTAESSVPDRAERRPGPVRDCVKVEFGVPETAGRLQGQDAGERSAIPPVLPPVHERADSGPTPPSNAGPAVMHHPADRKSAPFAAREHEAQPESGPQESPVPDGETPPADPPDPTGAVDQDPAAQQDTVLGSDDEPVPVPDEDEPPQDREPEDDWMRDLLPIARDAARTAGRISRDAIKDAVRAHQAVGNDKLGELVAALKDEETTTHRMAPPDSSRPLW
ncbi:DUF2637 domain-containing protein [Streptomyces niveiscabiei]|uniref:DUF2637 domain-containing protein n=1 Tax=Streptomyces niveiscabiei TaxID=164115 RepID=UPI0029B43D32|nr:DUF2637 domain-containing protein [Streptomyces niveiscabiei]MDX3388185.1 DUF2637 domain-containing protein [Streptomyces niveiscabiei]